MFNNGSSETFSVKLYRVHHKFIIENIFPVMLLQWTGKIPEEEKTLNLLLWRTSNIFRQNVTLLFKVQLIFMLVVYDTEKKYIKFYMNQPSSDIFHTSMSENVQKTPAKFSRKFCTRWLKKYSYEKIAVHRRYFLRNFLFTTAFPWKTYGCFSFNFLPFSKRYQKQANPFSSYHLLKWITIFHKNSFSEYGSN